jgi:hypothetical protein
VMAWPIKRPSIRIAAQTVHEGAQHA